MIPFDITDSDGNIIATVLINKEDSIILFDYIIDNSIVDTKEQSLFLPN